MEEDEKREIFQTPSQFESRSSRTSSGGAKKYLFILISIIVIGLLIFGVMRFFTGGDSETAMNPSPTIEAFPTDAFPSPTTDLSTPTPDEEKPTPTPSEKPTPTAKPSTSPVDKTTGLDRGKLSVRIMNGSGVAGAAKKVSDLLEGLGYNVIQIGNADNSDYGKTVIQITKEQDDFLPLLKKDLSDYTIDSTSDEPPSDEKADALIIIGKE